MANTTRHLLIFIKPTIVFWVNLINAIHKVLGKWNFNSFISDVPAIHIFIKKDKNAISIQLRGLEIACYFEYYALFFYHLTVTTFF